MITPTIQAPALSTGCRWDQKSQRPTASQFAKRVRGPSSLRKALRMTLAELSAALSNVSGRQWSRSTLSKFEAAHAGQADWQRHGASRFLRSAYEALIAVYVETRSRGKYTARLIGARTWRVKLVEVRHGTR